MGLALILLWDLLVMRTPRFAALYTDDGVLPRELLVGGVEESFFVLHLLAGSFAWQALLFGLLLLAAVLLGLGLFTRLATVVCWVLLASVQVRNPLTLNYGDELLRHLLFWGMFLPLGRVLSLDALRSPRVRDARDALLSTATAAVLLQVFCVYFFTGILKTGRDWWPDGTAVWYAINQDAWARPVAVALRDWPGLTRAVSYATLALEIVGPWLLFLPVATLGVRVVAVAAFALFQLSLAFSLSIGIFPLVNLVALVPFLPGALWDRLGVPRGASPGTSAVGPPAAAAGWLRRAREVLVGILLLYMLVINVKTVWPVLPLPDEVVRFGYLARLNQRWEMYAPDVPHRDGWLVMPGRLASGEMVDLSERGPILSWEKPEGLAASHLSYRWARYLWQLRNPKVNKIHRQRLAWWLCREWNTSHAPEERIERLDLYFVSELTPPPVAGHSVLERRHLARRDCRSVRPGARAPDHE
jgi:hypothetical protein